jgi:enoyl-CoA hydratase/carnithine racemase
VIAALNCHTIGGRLEIAMAADMPIARKDGGKTGVPEVTRGALPGTGGTQCLALLVGKPKAIELMRRVMEYAGPVRAAAKPDAVSVQTEDPRSSVQSFPFTS